MSKPAQHSPGPWADVSDAAAPPRTAQRMALVATSTGGRAIDCTGSGRDYAQDCANARLVAAAPDLLDALAHAVSGEPGSLKKALAAIAKATGA